MRFLKNIFVFVVVIFWVLNLHAYDEKLPSSFPEESKSDTSLPTPENEIDRVPSEISDETQEKDTPQDSISPKDTASHDQNISEVDISENNGTKDHSTSNSKEEHD